MAIDTVSPRSRRALLAAALGAGAATVASALGRPLPAKAADGNTVVVGGEYTSSSVTRIHNTTTNGDAGFWGASEAGIGVLGSSTSSTGVHGESNTGTGVQAYSATGVALRAETGSGVGLEAKSPNSIAVIGESAGYWGVYGKCPSGVGVVGESTSSTGVWGVTSTSGTGVFGASPELGVDGRGGTVGARGRGISTGVHGFSGPIDTPPPPPPIKTGVYGHATQDVNSRGVFGQSTAGRGVNGIATSGRGVHGQATTTGTAGWFTVNDPLKGTAVRAVGRVRLDNCAGVATIVATKSSVVVTPGIDLVATSAVVGTLQGSAGGAVVERVAVNTTANTFTIFLTKATPANVRVAWHVFG
jgi:hypothetical protein